MPENDRKAALGERLFVKVSEFNPELAPKITGMFLEMPLSEAFELLDNSRKLQEKIKEATYVIHSHQNKYCLLYTSDAADEEDSVDLGGRRIIKKKKNNINRQTDIDQSINRHKIRSRL
eukprot:TRINITY_DN4514_c0_g1_i3.p1 TRINITY_DN4514_c0_g1~~TRINITY_DN4514_c0_g1_i3.p1  ORF type:complete len:119 (-),score=41.50 TRINITY_DN4514_c0_g1_i3:8-364(-)